MSVRPSNGVRDILANSPFRVLGIWSNGSIKEQTANISRIKAYSKVGKQVSFKADLERFLGPADRSEENFTQAQAKIRLAEGKFTEALFWFINIDKLDSLALNYICKDDAEDADLNKADEIWTKSAKPHAWLNKAVLCLLKNDVSGALGCYDYFSRNLPEKSEVFTAALDIKASDLINRDSILTAVFKRLEPYVNESALERICKILEINTDYFVNKKSQASSQILLEIDELIRNISFDPSNQGNPSSYLEEEIKKFQPKADSYLNISGNQKSDEQFVKCLKHYLKLVQNYINYFVANSESTTKNDINSLYYVIDILKKFSDEKQLMNQFSRLAAEISCINTVREIIPFIDSCANSDFTKNFDWPSTVIFKYGDAINYLRTQSSFAYSIVAVRMSTAYFSIASAFLIAITPIFTSGKSLKVDVIQNTLDRIRRSADKLTDINQNVDSEAAEIIEDEYSKFKTAWDRAELNFNIYKENAPKFSFRQNAKNDDFDGCGCFIVIIVIGLIIYAML